AHAARKVAADRQAQADAVARPSETAVELHERLEDRGQLVGWNAAAGVFDHQRHDLPARLAGQCDASPRVAELDRVANEIEKNLLQLLAVGAHGNGFVASAEVERELPRPRLWKDERLDRRQQLAERDGGEPILDRSALDARGAVEYRLTTVALGEP